MFPDIARDDVFRLETRRLWLRWPRLSDAPAIERYCAKWEVARYTARIPHPYLPGSAERYIYAARESNASGRGLAMVLTQIRGKREPVGMIGLEARAQDRLTLGYALASQVWGRGLATEAAVAIVGAAFRLTNAVEIHAGAFVANPASRRVLEKVGFVYLGTGLDGAPARGGLVEADRFRLTRTDWAARRGAALELTS